MYKKDQVVSYTDQDGRTQQQLLSKHELRMYQIVNDPSKLAALNHFIMNDLSVPGLENQISKNVNSSIVAAIEGNRRKVPSNNENDFNNQTGNEIRSLETLASFKIPQ